MPRCSSTLMAEFYGRRARYSIDACVRAAYTEFTPGSGPPSSNRRLERVTPRLLPLHRGFGSRPSAPVTVGALAKVTMNIRHRIACWIAIVLMLLLLQVAADGATVASVECRDARNLPRCKEEAAMKRQLRSEEAVRANLNGRRALHRKAQDGLQATVNRLDAEDALASASRALQPPANLQRAAGEVIKPYEPGETVSRAREAMLNTLENPDMVSV